MIKKIITWLLSTLLGSFQSQWANDLKGLEQVVKVPLMFYWGKFSLLCNDVVLIFLKIIIFVTLQRSCIRLGKKLTGELMHGNELYFLIAEFSFVRNIEAVWLAYLEQTTLLTSSLEDRNVCAIELFHESPSHVITLICQKKKEKIWKCFWVWEMALGHIWQSYSSLLPRWESWVWYYQLNLWGSVLS